MKRTIYEEAAAKARRSLDNGDLRWALELLSKGWSKREIAKRFGVSHTTLNKWLARVDAAIDSVAPKPKPKRGRS